MTTSLTFPAVQRRETAPDLAQHCAAHSLLSALRLHLPGMHGVLSFLATRATLERPRIEQALAALSSSPETGPQLALAILQGAVVEREPDFRNQQNCACLH